MVTGESAHAWVEVYLKNVGWVAYDPTPGRGNALWRTPPPRKRKTPRNPPPPRIPAMYPNPPPLPSRRRTPSPIPTPSPAPQDPPTSQPTSQPDPQPQTQPETRRSVGRWLWIVLIVLLVALIAALLVWLVRKRLEKTDPIRLVARQKNPERGCMILYRSLLTLLLQMGHTPMSGETPEAFADRLSRSGLPNPDFVAFSGKSPSCAMPAGGRPGKHRPGYPGLPALPQPDEALRAAEVRSAPGPEGTGRFQSDTVIFTAGSLLSRHVPFF